MADAVIFDLDDTLVVDKDVVLTALMTACASAGERTDPGALMRAIWTAAYDGWQGANAGLSLARRGIMPIDGLLTASLPAEHRIQAWTRALAACGLDDAGLARRLDDRFRAVAFSTYRLHDDVASMLDALAGEVKLAIVTNGVADVQRHKLKKTGIGDRFQAVVISSEVGCAKPAAEIFIMACELLGVRAGETLMVGNDEDTDMAGARRAGLRAFLLDRSGAHRGAGAVASLAEVPGLVHGERAGDGSTAREPRGRKGSRR